MDLLYALTDIENKFIEEAAADDWNIVSVPMIKKSRLKISKLALTAILFLLAMTTLVYAVYKTDFFAEWFLNPDTKKEHVFESFSNAGIIADTSEFRIEALESIQSGEDIKIAFLITLKELGSAMISGSFPPQMRGYVFENVYFYDHERTNYCKKLTFSSIGYFYHADYTELQDNQILLVMDGSFTDPIESASIGFDNIGYYDGEGIFIAEYPETWRWTYFFEEQDTNYIHHTMDDEFVFNGWTYKLTDIKVSMLSCEFVYKLENWEEYDNSSEPLSFDFLDAATNISIQLNDGSNISLATSGGMATNEEGYWDGTFRIKSVFDVPIDPETITTIEYVGHSLQVKSALK